MALFAVLSSACCKWPFSVSARAMYSSIFVLISCLDFSFFSPDVNEDYEYAECVADIVHFKASMK